MNYPLYLAGKLSLSSSGNKKAPAVAVAITAVALSVAIMLASIAIVTGFKTQIRDKVVGFNGHLTIYAADFEGNPGNKLLMLSPELQNIVENDDHVKGLQIGISIPGVLKTSDEFKGIYLKGLNGPQSVSFFKKNIIDGTVPDFTNDTNKNKVIISEAAADQLNLKVGDKVNTYFISEDIKVRRLEVAALYNTHFSQYDDVLAFGATNLVQQVASLDENCGTYLEVYVDNFDKIDTYSNILQDRLDDGLLDGRLKERYHVETVMTQGAGFFNWLSLLDTNVVVVLTLMMIVGCMTLISGMLIIILEKKRFIGIMKALGAPTSKIRQIFIWLAIKIAFWGLIIGNGTMLALLMVQDKTHFVRLDPEAYYIDFVPVQISWISIALLNTGVLIITYLTLILPSRFVAGISPSETMRYE